uniref:F-box domain-containing protein n=1 Tax=Compsopogon caeruleus TaxID=31354 RepID=A0A7S1XDB5_9RHOD|mmetsp:Transcript_14881/g.30275  ORF Transcript_14881/g.30275 Transcript_14881/m.30275 type:complete len:523 (+) Transcript_14881:463-2031(+)|eukprot:CAMPEP_0184678988 /NCGR_PEP_ID=MMETSP0312-20130426/1804_1 /TAXON_ID=31354 /ORGANISM="Compsopogon coeruleus, Strain SAG 36.94" /LENGTH=522 /DNA_ID=CAMNT_0027128141 /DNA_START=494 /DNA_END=2062 /DNA_ORIENTATION=-
MDMERRGLEDIGSDDGTKEAPMREDEYEAHNSNSSTDENTMIHDDEEEDDQGEPDGQGSHNPATQGLAINVPARLKRRVQPGNGLAQGNPSASRSIGCLMGHRGACSSTVRAMEAEMSEPGAPVEPMLVDGAERGQLLHQANDCVLSGSLPTMRSQSHVSTSQGGNGIVSRLLELEAAHHLLTGETNNGLDLANIRGDGTNLKCNTRVIQVAPPTNCQLASGSKRLRTGVHSTMENLLGGGFDLNIAEGVPGDSVYRMVAELTKLISYVRSKPTVQEGSASFIRDYLRTLLVHTALSDLDDPALLPSSGANFFEDLPGELTKRIFGFLEGDDLAMVRLVCRKWDEFARDEEFWKRLCMKRWRALNNDAALWKLVDPNVAPGQVDSWRRIFPSISRSPQWRCTLQKTGRFICHLVAHQISGSPLGEGGLPHTLVVERRFNIAHLQTFVLPDASVLYFEPENEKDRSGYDDFIEYLVKRTRAGLALDNERRFIFIPPCEFSRAHGYDGSALLGVAQEAHMPLLP